MSKTVGFLKKKWDESIRNLSVEFYAAVSVFTNYWVKNTTAKAQAAKHIINLLIDMNDNSERFQDLIQSSPAGIGIAHFYRYAIMQKLGLIGLEEQITPTLLSQLSIIYSQNQAVLQELRYEAASPTAQIQKNVLGAIISYFINEFRFTAGNSGFASACFVVAKELDLQNISRSTWRKMINSANFSAGFWEKGSAHSRRVAAFLYLEQRFLQGLDDAGDSTAPPYSLVNPFPDELPPPYLDLLPLDPPPNYEEDPVLEIRAIPS